MKLISNSKYEEYLLLKNEFDKIKKKLEDDYYQQYVQIHNDMMNDHTQRINQETERRAKDLNSYESELDKLRKIIDSQKMQICDLIIKIDKLITIKKKQTKR